MSNYLCICLSPTLQRTVEFGSFQKNAVNRAKKYRLDASGKAVNSARVLSQLIHASGDFSGDAAGSVTGKLSGTSTECLSKNSKSAVRVLCPLGKMNSPEFCELAERDKLDVRSVQIPGRVRECLTLLDSNGGTTEVVCPEPASENEFSGEAEAFLSALSEELEKCDAVLFAGSTPPGWQEDFVSRISEKIAASKKVFLADFQGKMLLNALSVCTPDIIKINEEEFCSTFLKQGSGPLREDELKALIIQKSIELKNKIVVTRGEKSTFAADNGNFLEVQSEKVQAVNTTACGDSFSAGFLYQFVETGDFAAALEKGAWCASRNAESVVPGTIF